MNTDNLFLNFQNGKGKTQVIGKNKFGNMPKKNSEYLQLSDKNLYTGHSFRRTSAMLLTDDGSDLLTIRRHGGWKSTSVAEGYIEDSSSNKRKIGQMITSSIILPPSTANSSFKSQPLKRIKYNEVNFGASTSENSACAVLIEEKLESSSAVL